jgi:hypothetical protein
VQFTTHYHLRVDKFCGGNHSANDNITRFYASILYKQNAFSRIKLLHTAIAHERSLNNYHKRRVTICAEKYIVIVVGATYRRLQTICGCGIPTAIHGNIIVSRPFALIFNGKLAIWALTKTNSKTEQTDRPSILVLFDRAKFQASRLPYSSLLRLMFLFAKCLNC